MFVTVAPQDPPPLPTPAPAAGPHRARLRRLLIRRATPHLYLTPALILLVVWAGLAGISGEYDEAARVDGASPGNWDCAASWAPRASSGVR
ncbi:hypothetical protein ACFXG4_37390 [Nocardia sp. NPDC059246]|uniref:hypothetical protein n=1 Tax=unclassified Nocardia TaxID=2637762 RepID=UPI0036C99D5E